MRGAAWGAADHTSVPNLARHRAVGPASRPGSNKPATIVSVTRTGEGSLYSMRSDRTWSSGRRVLVDRSYTSAMVRRVALAVAFLAPMFAALVVETPVSRAQDPITVTMVTDTAGLGDQNFNDLAHEGLQRAAADFGIIPKVIESQDATSYIPNLTAGAEQGELTIGVGFLLTEAITEVAEQFPDDKFLLIDSVSEAENVASVTFKENEGAFLAGVAAGRTTKTNKIGVVGGQKIPPVERYVVGFQAGVKSVNPNAQVSVAYADSFEDPALGKELSLAQFNQGADIVFPVAGRTGVGSYEAAKEKGPGFLAIGADRNQEDLAPGQQLAFAAKGVDTAVYTVIKQVVENQFQGGQQSLGLKEGGVGLGAPGAMVTPEVLAEVDLYRQAIIDGRLTVPSTEEELETFQPVDVGTPTASPVASPESTPTA